MRKRRDLGDKGERREQYEGIGSEAKSSPPYLQLHHLRYHLKAEYLQHCLDMICSCPLYIMQCDNSIAEEIGIFTGKHISLTWGPEHSLPAEQVPQAKEPLFFCRWPLSSLQEWQYILHQPVIHLKVLHRSCSASLCQKNKIERG